LEQLEASAQGLPFSPETYMLAASFMHVSGIEYTIDTRHAFNAGESYRDRIWHRAESVERVTITSINGAPFDPTAVYAVITSNANFNGMDISYVLAARESDTEFLSTITTARVTDHAVAGFIASLPQQTIGAAQAQLEGRITVMGAATPAMDVLILEEPAPAEIAPTPAFADYYLTQSMFLDMLGLAHDDADTYLTRQALIMILHESQIIPLASGLQLVNEAGDIADWAYYAIFNTQADFSLHERVNRSVVDAILQGGL
jgi:hypothetical protein